MIITLLESSNLLFDDSGWLPRWGTPVPLDEAAEEVLKPQNLFDEYWTTTKTAASDIWTVSRWMDSFYLMLSFGWLSQQDFTNSRGWTQLIKDLYKEELHDEIGAKTLEEYYGGYAKLVSWINWPFAQARDLDAIAKQLNEGANSQKKVLIVRALVGLTLVLTVQLVKYYMSRKVKDLKIMDDAALAESPVEVETPYDDHIDDLDQNFEEDQLILQADQPLAENQGESDTSEDQHVHDENCNHDHSETESEDEIKNQLDAEKVETAESETNGQKMLKYTKTTFKGVAALLLTAISLKGVTSILIRTEVVSQKNKNIRSIRGFISYLIPDSAWFFFLPSEAAWKD